MPVDIIFTIDESGSVGEENFKQTVDALTNVIDNLVIREDIIRVGVTLFEGTGTSRTIFDLNHSYDKSTIRQLLSDIVYKKGSTTDIADTLRYVCQDMFTNNKGDRTEAQNYLVLLTDGKSNKNKAINQAALCNSRNVRIISVGIGSGIDVDLLATVAYEPDYYINTEYSVLNTTLPTLVSTVVECSQGKNTAVTKLVNTMYVKLPLSKTSYHLCLPSSGERCCFCPEWSSICHKGLYSHDKHRGHTILNS